MARSPNRKEEPDRWFIQIQGQITGPVPGFKVLERMIHAEIDVTHRVSRDRRAWAAICNTPFFEELITARIRAYTGETASVGQMKPGGDDEEFEISQVFGLHGATDGISEQLDHARQLEELTANIQRLNALKKEILHNRKTVFIEKEFDPSSEIHPDDQNVFIAAEKKGVPWSAVFKGRGTQQKRMIALLIFVVTGASISQAYLYFSNQKNLTEDRTKLAVALDAQKQGDYHRAMATFKTMKSTNAASAQELIKLADAHISGRDIKTGQVLLTRAFGMNLEPKDLARAHALQSLIATQSGDLQQATIELESSLKHAEIFSTLHNLAILKIKTGKYSEAEPLLLKAIEVAAKNTKLDTSTTLIALFATAFQLDQHEIATRKDGDKKTERLASVAEMIEAHIKTSKSKEELHLVLAVARATLLQREAFQLSAYELIDTPANSQDQADHSGLDTDLSRWTNLVSYCTDIYNRPKSGDFVAAFYASCLWRSHGAKQALPFAKYALAMRPQDPVYAGLTAALLVEINQPDEAKKILFSNGIPIVGSKLADITLGKFNNRTPSARP